MRAQHLITGYMFHIVATSSARSVQHKRRGEDGALHLTQDRGRRGLHDRNPPNATRNCFTYYTKQWKSDRRNGRGQDTARKRTATNGS